MTDTPEALCLTKTQIFYTKTALDLLAQQYDAEHPDHASACRMLAARVAAHQNDKADPTPEQMQAWQDRFAGCFGDPEQMHRATHEWFHELLSTSPDPVRMFLSMFMPMIHQSRMSTALEIIFTLHAKLNDMCERGFDADAALNAMIQYLDRGQQQLERGEQLWHDDPELPTIVQKLHEKLVQQREQAAAALPTPPVA